MSPEQIRSKGVDGRSDLYSLGCMLFELVTGDVPYSGGNTLGLAYMHVHEEPPRASERAPKAGVPPALDAFLIRALAKEPGDRPRDAAAFRDELRAAASAEPVVAVARTNSKPLAKPETQPKAAKPARGADTKPRADKVKTQPRMRTPNALQRTLVGFTDLARRGFRRRKSLGERLRSRLRAWRGRSRSQKRLVSIAIVSLLAISLVGVGAYLATHPDKAREAAAPAIPATKPAPAIPATAKPAPPPTKPPRKRAGTRP
jgi:serine/threonine protein kinase